MYKKKIHKAITTFLSLFFLLTMLNVLYAQDDIIGVWIDDIIGLKITIIKKNSGYLINHQHKDGSGRTKKGIAFIVKGKQAFREEGDKHGDYYVIESSGQLGVYDSLGLITTMRAIK